MRMIVLYIDKDSYLKFIYMLRTIMSIEKKKRRRRFEAFIMLYETYYRLFSF